MPVIAIAVQKGGSGKTTTVLNLGAALHRSGKRVLLVDADPQANLTQSLGIIDEPEQNLYTEIQKEIAGKGSNLEAIIHTSPSGLRLIPSSIDLAGAELELVSVYGREQVMTWMLDHIRSDYDYILIDCPPAIGMLTVNALVASDYVLMPLQAEFLPLKGVRSFMHHFNAVRKLNRELKILGFVVTRYDERKVLNRQTNEELEKEFGEKTFQVHIRNNIQLANAQKAGMDIFSFDPQCHGAEDYARLAIEFEEKMNSSLTSQLHVGSPTMPDKTEQY